METPIPNGGHADDGYPEEQKRAIFNDEEESFEIPVDARNIRIAMLGNVDSGKSTTSAMLTSAPGSTDDGRGAMREKVFNFAHEKGNGRTSSVAHEIMGFKADGSQYVTTVSHTTRKNKIWPDIVRNSAKLVHLLDMCGHQKYLKTTMHGLTSLYPDYCFLVIGANMGISKMTKEHLACSLALDLPVFVVFTKIDLAPEEIFKANLEKISNIMKRHCDKVPVKVKTAADVDQVVNTIETGKVCPIFAISNTTGEHVELLRLFLSRLPKVRAATVAQESAVSQAGSEITHKFVIDSRYFSKGVGLILGGTVLKGSVRLNQEMMFGPDKHGNFKPVVIKGIHENRVDVTEAGEMASICVNVKVSGKNAEPIKNNHIRKGSCLINTLAQKAKGINQYHSQCIRYFDAQMKVLHHATTIQEGYQGVLHIGGVRQTVQAVRVARAAKAGKEEPAEDSGHMRNGDSGMIRFKFKYGVELIEEDTKIMVREGNTKAFGFIKHTYPMNAPPADLVDNFIIPTSETASVSATSGCRAAKRGQQSQTE